MSATKTWNPTRYQGLYKHANGTYYVRVGGNKTWRSLKTKIQSVALKRRDVVQLEAERQLDNQATIKMDGTTVGSAIEVRRWQLLNDVSIKNSTRIFWNDILQCVLNSWRGLAERDLRKITREECEQWAGRECKKVSASHFNNLLLALRHLFQIGVEAGLIVRNPTASIKRAKPKSKDLLSKLPSRDEFAQFVAEVRNTRSRWNQASGNLVEFLAYSGLRIGEARQICWKHIDWEREELVVEGDQANDGTKNWKSRRVPIINELRALLTGIRKARSSEASSEKVLLVGSATTAMRNAADKLGIERITHHDLRHLFATTAIESGVDIPTVAYWLGHRDGGALAMRVYGHLRNEHSKAAAKRVSFSRVN